MKYNFRLGVFNSQKFLKVVLVMSTICCLMLPLSAQTSQKQPLLSLIPIKLSDAAKFLERFKRSQATQFPDLSKMQIRSSGQGHIEYIFEASDGTMFSINANTSDVDITYRGFKPVDESESKREAIDPALIQKAITIKNSFYQAPEKLTLSKTRKSSAFVSVLQEDKSFKKIDPFFSVTMGFTELNALNGTSIKTLNRCDIQLRRDTNDLMWFASSYRPNLVSLQPNYSHQEAVAIARWNLSQDKQISFQILRASEYSAEQKRAVRLVPTKKDLNRVDKIIIEEDPWLHQRMVWEIVFNVGQVTLDAHSGQMVRVEAAPEITGPGSADFLRPFEAAQTIIIPKPERQPMTPASIELAVVNFNGDILRPDDFLLGLHHSPIIRSDSPLVYSEYFPNFLITTEIKGDEITLEGQLKEKHRAVLKLGEKKYVLDGQEFEFATPPVKIDDRIYLPAELLQKLNGVLIRWEPKKKLLWVDTRYLRR